MSDLWRFLFIIVLAGGTIVAAQTGLLADVSSVVADWWIDNVSFGDR